MTDIFQWLNQPLPIGIVMMVGLVVLWLRVNDNSKAVRDLRTVCEARLKWCINHFDIKNPKGGDDT